MVDEQLESLAGVRQLLAGGDILRPVRHLQKALAKLQKYLHYQWLWPITEGTTFTCCHRNNSSRFGFPGAPSWLSDFTYSNLCAR